ncbi:MAG: TetR/AcrR family transcriptional regulator [Treponema sp.]|nr:TetR/AcrR family transcriptional regulator [Treponema sp.]
MRTADPELEKMILEKTLGLLMEHEPDQIGMRDIARACGISATAIYHYYQDKTALFEAVKLDCLGGLKTFMVEKITAEQTTYDKVRASLEAFAEWCFDNPQKALLVMGRLKANTTASAEELKPYYECSELGVHLLEQAVREHTAVSDNPRLDTSVAVSALWGTVEAILLNRADPSYWQSGKKYTDRFITMYLSVIFPKGRNI